MKKKPWFGGVAGVDLVGRSWIVVRGENGFDGKIFWDWEGFERKWMVT